jgi:diacylglycerol kinase family enzyme
VVSKTGDQNEFPKAKKPATVHLIYNPIAGTFREETVLSLKTLLLAAGTDVDILPTKGPRHAVALSREAARSPEPPGYEKIIAVYGGDGTHGDVLDGILSAQQGQTASSIGPLNANIASYLAIAGGTSSDGAKAAGVSSGREAAGRIISYLNGERKAKYVNVLQVEADGEKRLVLSHAGIGITGKITEWTDSKKGKDAKRIFGPLAYQIYGLYTFCFSKPVESEITLGTNLPFYLPVLGFDVGQAKSMGSVKEWFPGVSPFEVSRVVIMGDNLPRYLAPAALIAANKGDHLKFPGITSYLEGTDYEGPVSIRLEKPLPVDVSGELISGVTNFRMERIPGAVKTF